MALEEEAITDDEDQVVEDQDDEEDEDEDEGEADGEGSDVEPESSDEDDDEKDDEQRKAQEERRERRRREKAERAEKRRQHDLERRRMLLENEELRRRLDRIESVHTSEYERRIDSAISEAKSYLEQAEREMEDAISTNDGPRATAAQALRDEAREKIRDFQNVKREIETAKQAPRQGLDQVLINNANIFRSRHPNYNPNGIDPYSVMVNNIDVRLRQEGVLHPTQSSYWAELERRVKIGTARLQQGQQAQQKPSGQQPRRQIGSPTAGGAKPSQSRDGWTLSSARRDAMKKAGLVEGTTQWKEMVADYKKFDKERA